MREHLKALELLILLAFRLAGEAAGLVLSGALIIVMFGWPLLLVGYVAWRLLF